MYISPSVTHWYTHYCHLIVQKSPIWSCVLRELAINHLEPKRSSLFCTGKTCYHLFNMMKPNKISLHFHIFKNYLCLSIQLSFYLFPNGQLNLLIFCIMAWPHNQFIPRNSKQTSIMHPKEVFNLHFDLCTTLTSRISCQKGHSRHAYAWRIGPFWQDTLDIYNTMSMAQHKTAVTPLLMH